MPGILGARHLWTVFSSLVLSSLELSDAKVYEPQIRARLRTTALWVTLILKGVILNPLSIRDTEPPFDSTS